MSTPSPSPGRLVAGWYLVVLLLSGGLLLLQGALAVAPEAISLVQLAPLLGVLAVTAVSSRARAALPPSADRRAVTRSLLGGVLLTLGYAVALALLARAGGADVPAPPVTLLLFVLLQLAGATAEEVGWRGFMQPALEARLPRLVACLVTGVLWSLWHVQMLTDPLVAAVFVLSAVALSIAFGYVVVGSVWQRGLVAGVMHGGVNLALFFFAGPAGLPLEAAPTPLVMVVPLLAVLLWRRARARVASVAAQA